MEYMEFYIDCFEIGAFKNKPDIYLAAAERLGATVPECAVFEDAEYCAKTAHDAVLWYWRSVLSYVHIRYSSDLRLSASSNAHIPFLLASRSCCRITFRPMREHYANTIILKEGVIEALKEARRQGIKCCIAII